MVLAGAPHFFKSTIRGLLMRRKLGSAVCFCDVCKLTVVDRRPESYKNLIPSVERGVRKFRNLITIFSRDGFSRRTG